MFHADPHQILSKYVKYFWSISHFYSFSLDIQNFIESSNLVWRWNIYLIVMFVSINFVKSILNYLRYPVNT